MVIKKENLKKIIQQLPEESLPKAGEFLKNLLSESSSHRYIPIDDEPTTDEDLQDIREAREEFKRGEGIKFSDVKNELYN